MAPQSAQTDALRAPDLLLYTMKNALSVVVWGHDVRVVRVAHEGVGALLNCAKYKRSREAGLFSNIAKKKVAPNLKTSRKTSEVTSAVRVELYQGSMRIYVP